MLYFISLCATYDQADKHTQTRLETGKRNRRGKGGLKPNNRTTFIDTLVVRCVYLEIVYCGILTTFLTLLEFTWATYEISSSAVYTIISSNIIIIIAVVSIKRVEYTAKYMFVCLFTVSNK